jgi:hypothetical protein
MLQDSKCQLTGNGVAMFGGCNQQKEKEEKEKRKGLSTKKTWSSYLET